MKAIQIKQYGGEEQLELVDVARPEPGPKQVLVRIAATTFNPVDRKRTSGDMKAVFPISFPHIPGGDFSGVVEAAGAEVEGIGVGDPVIGYSMAGGSYAEYIAVDADKVARKPKSVGHVEAAALSMVSLTALQMLERASLQPGQTVLIHGAGGAVGGVAVQVAHPRGIKVIATASTASFNRVTAYGADQAIDYKTTPFEEVVKNVDAVLDTVGGPVQQRSYRVLKAGGRLVSATQPPSPEEAAKYGVSASMVFTEVSSAGLETVARMIDAGEIKPCVGRVYPLSEVAQAWRDIRTTHIEGKVVFLVGDARDDR